MQLMQLRYHFRSCAVKIIACGRVWEHESYAICQGKHANYDLTGYFEYMSATVYYETMQLAP
jgi:hypothetical protein